MLAGPRSPASGAPPSRPLPVRPNPSQKNSLGCENSQYTDFASRPALPETNKTCSDSEVALAIQERLIAEEELQLLDNAISTLLACRARAIDRIKSCDAVFAPHKMLSSPLLSYIMSLIVPESISFPLEDRGHDPLLRLTQVCSDWRHLALSLPALRTLTFMVPGFSFGDIELANSWLSKSSISPLSITVCGSSPVAPTVYMERTSPNVDHDRLSIQSLLERVLIPYSHHIQTLAVTAHPQFLQKLASSTVFFSLLQTVFLRLAKSSYDSPSGDAPLAFPPASLLESVTFIQPRWSSLKLNFPWQQLTKLHLVGTLFADTYLPILSQCTSLVYCELHNMALKRPREGDIENNIPLPSTTLPNLTTLSIGFSAPSNRGPILLALVLPRMVSLSIDTPPYVGWSDLDYTAFFAPMASTLSQFEMINVQSKGPIDDTLLSYLGCIESLKLPSGYTISPSTMEKIGSGELLPQLTYLAFTTTDIEDVIEMLDSRQLVAEFSSPLVVSLIKTAWIRCPIPGKAVEHELELTELILRGIDVAIVEEIRLLHQPEDIQIST